MSDTELGKQTCTSGCRYCSYVDQDPEPNWSFLNEVGLEYFKAKGIIEKDGGVIAYCNLAPGAFVVLGIPCQVPEEYVDAISKLN